MEVETNLKLALRASSSSASPLTSGSDKAPKDDGTVVVHVPAGSTAYDIARAREAMTCMEVLIKAELDLARLA